MTGVADRFVLLASQGRDDDVLLGATWFEGMGMRLFGAEAISGALRRHPMVVSDASTVRVCGDALAIIDGEHALFAELIDGRAHRLWRIGAPAEEGIATTTVAFDPDLGQVADRVWFTASDHENLGPDSASRLLAYLDDYARQAEDGTTYRCRIAVRRAFDANGGSAALLTIYRWPASGPRVPMLANAVVALSGDNARIAIDPDDPARAVAGWRPRI